MPTNSPSALPLLETTRRETQELYHDATALVADNLQRALRDQPPDLAVCRPLAERLLAAMREAPMDLMLLALRPKSAPFFLAAHPVNVAIIMLELVRDTTVVPMPPLDIALLGVLHDVGMAQVEDVIQLPRQLTSEERVAMERHVQVTHELLEHTSSLSPEIVAAATEEHERLDGSGYPAKRRRSDLHRFGTLLAVADVFEAMTHDRPHQAARAPYVVLRELLTMGADVLDAEFLKLLVFRLGVYPVGSWVELSSREIARVVETRPATPLRPLVEVVADPNHQALLERRLLDLSARPGVAIKRWLDEATLQRSVNGLS